jgi:hypothetical protein
MDIPSPAEFKKGYQAFQLWERRDAMYKIATFLVDHFWGSPSEMADGLGVLLLTWNQAFYRYGPFDFDRLEECMSSNLNLLQGYRERTILDHSSADDKPIRHLFQQFLTALQICEGRKEGTKSPVAVSKALHLLAPEFFPLWDVKIARAYHCRYNDRPADKYLSFLRKMKRMAEELQFVVDPRETSKTFLKLIDEYNYAKFTKGWI